MNTRELLSVLERASTTNVRESAAEVLSMIIPNIIARNPFEKYVFETLSDSERIIDEYSYPPDKISLMGLFSYGLCREFSADPIEVLSFRQECLKSNNINFDAAREILLESAYIGLYSAGLLISSQCIGGIFLYPNSNHSVDPLSDQHPIYAKLIQWEYSIVELVINDTKLPERISNYFPCDFDTVYVSKSGIESLKYFDTVASKYGSYENTIMRDAYRAFLDNQFKNSDHSDLNRQMQRELILLGWMAGNEIRKGEQITSHSRKEVWNELESFCPQHFPAKLSPSAMESFFKSCVKAGICKFQ